MELVFISCTIVVVLFLWRIVSDIDALPHRNYAIDIQEELKKISDLIEKQHNLLERMNDREKRDRSYNKPYNECISHINDCRMTLDNIYQEVRSNGGSIHNCYNELKKIRQSVRGSDDW